MTIVASIAAWAESPLPRGVQKSLPLTVTLLGPKDVHSLQQSRWRFLLGSSPLVDFHFRLKMIDESHPAGLEMGRALREAAGLGSPAETPWVWLAHSFDGRLITTGKTFPVSGQLFETLEADQGPTIVSRLQAFLVRHPEHWEARRDLIDALGRRLRADLVKRMPSSGADFDLQEDVKIWGPIATQLDLAFQDTDWVSRVRPVILTGLLPEGTPERSSPLMRDLYLRCRPKVEAILRRAPDRGAAWYVLLRMNRVLGGSVLSVVGDLPNLNSKGYTHFEPAFLTIAGSIVEEARTSGNWNEAKRVLQWIWEVQIRPTFENGKLSSFSMMAPQTDPQESPESRASQVVWSKLLAPLFEATIRSGGLEGEVAAIARSIDPGWGEVCTNARFKSLMVKLKRAELASLLSSWTKPSPLLPPNYCPLSGFRLFHQGQADSSKISQIRGAFSRKGLFVQEQKDPSGPVRAHLHWPEPSAPKWALIDPGGRPLFQGKSLPDSKILLQQFLDARIPTEADYLRNYLQTYPQDLTAWARLASQYSAQGRACLDGMGGPLDSLSQATVIEDAEKCWAEYARCMDRILTDPLGTSEEILTTFRPWNDLEFLKALQYGKTSSTEGIPLKFSSLGQDMASKYLSRVEEDLSRRPSDFGLWVLWMALAAHGQKSPVELLDRLEPSPVHERSPLWPNPPIVESVARDLKKQERWQEIINLLLPRWEMLIGENEKAIQKARKPSVSAQGWDHHLSKLLIEAEFRLGRITDAETILNDAKKQGIQLGSMSEIMVGN